MGRNFDQIMDELARLGDNPSVSVTVATNESNGVVSYATGELWYSPARAVDGVPTPAYISDRGHPLSQYFSDKRGHVESGLAIQPFGLVGAKPLFCLSISKGPFNSLPIVAKFKRSNRVFSITLEARENLLIGLGPPIRTSAAKALYVLSLYSPVPRPNI